MPALLHWLLRLLPTNPIGLRVVRNGSRRNRQLLIRGAFLGVLILLMLSMLLFTVSSGSLSLRSLASSGATIFTWVSVLEVLLICLITPIFMAGAIAHESNPRTWDILLTTPLSSLQIVLGNLFGRWFLVFALLISSLPLFMILRFFGGVPGESIFGAFAIAASTSLLVAAIAVTMSVTRVGGKRSVFAFYCGIVVALFLTYAIDRQMRLPVPGTVDSNWTTIMTPLNPFLALEVLLASKSYVPHDQLDSTWLTRVWLAQPVVTFVWLCITTSTLLVVISTVCVRVFARNGGTESALRRLVGLTPSGALERQPRPVGHNAVAWRESHRGAGGWSGIIARWSFVAMTMLATIVILWLHHAGSMTLAGLRDSIGFLVLGEVCLVTLIAINLSATAVSKEREDGSLDIILTTPIQPGAYLAGKHRGVVRFLLPMICVPVASLVLVMLYTFMHGLGTPVTSTVTLAGGTTVDVPLIQWQAVAAFSIVFVPFTAFCVMIGLMWSIRSRGSIGSVITGILIIGGLIVTLSLCAIPPMNSSGIFSPMAAAVSPVNIVLTALKPNEWLPNALGENNISLIWLLVGGIMVAGCYATGAVLLHRQMTRTFMMTVRQLAGTS
jgi:ABC-type transport system involved in multi-copper enzyme maturation permease subunit